MDIFFQGAYNSEEAAESLLSVLRLFKESYHIENFHDMRLSLVLVDVTGNEVELVDTETGEVYRRFEVYHQGKALKLTSTHRPILQLVIDNT